MSSPSALRARPLGLIGGLCRVVAAVAVLLGLFGVAMAPAAAHTDLVGSDPANGASLLRAPNQVTLTFNEAMDPRLASVTLTVGPGVSTPLSVVAGAEPTELIARVPEATAGGGRWRIAFRVTSTDGHPVQGEFSFRVNPPAAPTTDAPSAASGTEPTARPSDSPSSSSGDGRPRFIGAVGLAIGGFLILLAVLIVVARYLRVEES